MFLNELYFFIKIIFTEMIEIISNEVSVEMKFPPGSLKLFKKKQKPVDKEKKKMQIS